MDVVTTGGVIVVNTLDVIVSISVGYEVALEVILLSQNNNNLKGHQRYMYQRKIRRDNHD
jgi:hypothetical protein